PTIFGTILIINIYYSISLTNRFFTFDVSTATEGPMEDEK
ncbi:unnamed protein product, partial [marine sediment metagenome]